MMAEGHGRSALVTAALALALSLVALRTLAQTTTAIEPHVVRLIDQGAKCDGVTDDTAAIAAWLAAARPYVVLKAPAGVCVFASALAAPSGGLSAVAIIGEGAYQTVFRYAGPSTTTDLLTIGDGANNYLNWSLSGFSVTSSTVMTSGAGMRLRRVGRSTIRNVVWDGQDGRGRLYDGVWFDRVDEIFVSQFEARGSHDAVAVSGAVGKGMKAGLFLAQGKISASGTGIHMGGAFGGLATTQVDIIANRTNVVIDTALAAEGNREAFFDTTTNMDTATGGDSIIVDDALTGAMTLVFNNWLATGTAAGLDIVHCAGCKVSIGAPVIWNFRGDGIRIQDPATFVTIGGATMIHDNGGYGIDRTATPTTGVLSSMAVVLANRLGAYSPNTGLPADRR